MKNKLIIITIRLPCFKEQCLVITLIILVTTLLKFKEQCLNDTVICITAAWHKKTIVWREGW